MARPITLLLLLCLLSARSATATWLPPPDRAPVDKRPPTDVAPAAPWPGRIPSADPRGYDVLAYGLELELVALPPRTPRIAGTCHIRLRLLDDPPAELRLDLVDQLSVGAVLQDGAPVPWIHAGDSLRVALANPPMAGAELTVSVTYAGSPPRHGPYWAGLLLRRRGSLEPDDPQAGAPTVGNVSQPYSSHSWFPCKDHPADKATLELSVIAPDGLTVVATGQLLATTALPDARRRWNWATDYPVAPYLIGLAASDFVSWHEDCGSVPLEFHTFPDLRARAEPIFAPTCAMLQWLEDRLGPYPFAGEKYAQAVFAWGGAMENQTVTMVGQTLFFLPVRTAQLFVVHELVHHWFGNCLTPAHWRDIWLNEGFARYHEALWLEHTEGRQAYLDYLALLRSPSLFAGEGLLGDPDPVLPNPLVYDKGAWVLHMLRHELGDELFFAAVRAYAEEPSLVHATTDRAALTDVFSRTAGRDLGAWLAPWLDSEETPRLGVRWRSLAGGRALVEVVQAQGPPFFPLSVPVRVFAGPAVVDLRLTMSDLLAGAVVDLAAPIDSVQIDPEGWLLHRTALTPPAAVLAAEPRPNPSRDQIELTYWLAGADRVVAAVYDARGSLVVRRDLGALPATGPRDAGGEPLRWIWDGKDGAGRAAAAGVYWLELRGTTGRTVRKATLLR